MRQRTLKTSVKLDGIGLQTGHKVTVTLGPAPAGRGIDFIRSDLPGRPCLNLNEVVLGPVAGSPERRTTIGSGDIQIQTTEHLLAVFSALGVDNATVEIDSAELPGMDGSAKGFLDAVRQAGVMEQDAPKKVFEVKEPIWSSSADALLVLLPGGSFRVSYTLAYPGIGSQFFSADIDEATFEREISPARTFCSESEAMQLLKMGLGKGANYENTLVMGSDGPVSNTLRFPDEPVRHKVLDLVGDLYLAGGYIKAHVVALKSGHKLNMELVRKLRGL